MRPVINTEKHYQHTPVTSVGTGVAQTFELIDASADPTQANEVREGAVVKAIFVEYWVEGDMQDSTVTGVVSKQPSGAAAPTIGNMSNLGAYLNKKNILEAHQGLQPSSGNIIPMFRHWILIPKGKQRFGLGDKLTITFSSLVGTLSVCGFATFKEHY